MREQVSRLAFDLHVCLHNTQITATVNPSCLIPTRSNSLPGLAGWFHLSSVSGDRELTHAGCSLVSTDMPWCACSYKYTHILTQQRANVRKYERTDLLLLEFFHNICRKGVMTEPESTPSEQSVATSLGWEPRSTP